MVNVKPGGDGDKDHAIFHKQSDLRPKQGHDDKWEEFLSTFQELLKPDSPTGIAVFAFLSNRLRQYRLNNLYTHADVLNEVLLRAHKLVHSEGVTILQPAAWVKKTGFHVISEWSRKKHKATSLTEDVLEWLDYSRVSEDRIQDDFVAVNQALTLLEPEEQRLLQLKLVECLSWRDIWEVFRDEGYEYTESALRKKKERILNKLRYYYHALKLEPLSDLDSIFSPSPTKVKKRS